VIYMYILTFGGHGMPIHKVVVVDENILFDMRKRSEHDSCIVVPAKTTAVRRCTVVGRQR